MAHFIGLVVPVVVVVMARKLVRRGAVWEVTLWTGLKMSYRFINLCELLSRMVICFFFFILPPAAARGQMINVSKLLEIARFEMVFEFISFHDGLTKGERREWERGRGRVSEIEAACPPKSVGSYSIMEIYAKTC